MAVPEAPVNENSESMGGPNEIRLSGKRAMPAPSLQPGLLEKPDKVHLSSLVACTVDARHQLRAREPAK